MTGFAAYLTTRHTLYRELDRELVGAATVAAKRITPDTGNIDDYSGVDLQLGNVLVMLIRADGQQTRPAQEQASLLLAPQELAVARKGTDDSVRSGRSSDGQAFRIAAVPVSGQPGYALVLGRPLAATERVLASLFVVLLIFGAAGVFWASVAGLTVARSSLAPVRRLTQAVEGVARTNQLAPVEVTGTDELSRLAAAFNRMLRSLSTSRERQQRLIADAGHELRTPLTSLRTNIELLAADERSHLLPSDARVEIMHDVTAQLMEFAALIGDLVQLARDDRVAAAPEPIDLRTVIEAAVARAQRRGPGLTFDVELNPLWVVGEPDSLERAITNLLDNAVKFSPPGGTVYVHLEGDRLRIADQGPGIAEEDRPFVFDRFFRSERSRNTPGTGLGLSIVAQTVARHGGWVKVGRSAQGGAEFTARLPGSTSLEGLSEVPPTLDDDL
ncbi:MAG: ATP-binding protein [Propionibacteriaceae bacterium]